MNHPTRFPFTNRMLERLPKFEHAGGAKCDEYSDTKQIGLKLAKGDSRATFYYRYVFRGKKRALRIGEFPGITVEEARRIALEARASVDRGQDPQVAKDHEKRVPSFRDFVIEQYLPFAREHKKSADADESKFREHLDEVFGARRLSDIERRDIATYHASLKSRVSKKTKKALHPSTANRHLALLSAIFARAIEWGLISANPCTGVKQFREEHNHQRFLTTAELARLYAAMENETNRTAVAIVRLLTTTGVRRSEASAAKRSHIDLANSTWLLPHTKAGRSRYVALNSDARALLESQLNSHTSEWVFPAERGEGHYVNVTKPFERMLRAAGIERCRVHDLRHTFCSQAVMAGVPLYVVQHLAGHASSQMTQRYAHLAQDTIRQASQQVADALRGGKRLAPDQGPPAAPA